MIFSNQMPENSFRETGFYDYIFPSLRYTGKYGLVYHDIPINNLPKPYGDTENISSCILALPFYLIEQLGESFRAFYINLTSKYSSKRSYKDDLKLLPYALADFLPALLTAITSALSPIILVIYAILEADEAGDYHDPRFDYYSRTNAYIYLAILGSPLIAVAGALIGAWELIAATLMFVKAGLETGFAMLNIISIPFKYIATCISDALECKIDVALLSP